MIFVDSNIPMYLVGAQHPYKEVTAAALDELARKQEVLVTNAEVIQEILYRYSAINRRDFIQIALDALYEVVDQVLSIEEQDVLQAKNILMSYPNMDARDALHAAHLQRYSIETIFSFDKGFDVLPRVHRVPQ